MKDIKKYNLLLKIFVLVIITILIFPFIVKKISNIIKKRNNEQLSINIIENEEEKNYFLRLLDFLSSSKKICDRGSKSLKKYFETGDTQYVNLYDFEGKSNPPKYIIELVEALDEQDESKQDDLIEHYIRHHLILVILYFVVAIVSIAGWIACGVCCCCNCRCFPCCLDSKCLYPFFVVCTVMNLIIIICCIIGLVKTHLIFKALANSECSLLNFINEGIEGESKQTLPKWGGIYTILEILNKTEKEIEDLSKNQDSELNNTIIYNKTRANFEKFLINSTNIIKNEQRYKKNYLSKNYILDIAKKFGEYNDSTKQFPNGSYCYRWLNEIPEIGFTERLYYDLSDIINIKTRELLGLVSLHIQNLSYSLEDVKDLIGDEVVQYADDIDKYGKLAFYLAFSLVLFFTVVLQILLIIYIFFCSGKTPIKVFIHIFWYILALLMFIIFLIGTFCTLLGKLGSDIIEMFSYIISPQNLESESPLIFRDAEFLNECINGNGDLASLSQIKFLFEKIDEIKNYLQFLDVYLKLIISMKKDNIYNSVIEEINERKDLDITNFGFIGVNSSFYNNSDYLKLDQCVSNLNKEIQSCSINDRWSFTCESEFPQLEEEKCNLASNNKCMDPSTCSNNELSKKYQNIGCTQADELAKVVDAIFSSVDFAANESEINSLINQAGNISEQYSIYLNVTRNTLNNYITFFLPITIIFDALVGTESIVVFLNCAFLGENIRVMLYYLYHKVAKETKRLAVLLLIIGLAIGISIAFLLAIINIINKEQNDKKNKIKSPSADTTNAEINTDKSVSIPSQKEYSTNSSNKNNNNFPMNTTINKENY